MAGPQQNAHLTIDAFLSQVNAEESDSYDEMFPDSSAPSNNATDCGGVQL